MPPLGAPLLLPPLVELPASEAAAVELPNRVWGLAASRPGPLAGWLHAALVKACGSSGAALGGWNSGGDGAALASAAASANTWGGCMLLAMRCLLSAGGRRCSTRPRGARKPVQSLHGAAG